MILALIHLILFYESYYVMLAKHELISY